MDQVNVPSQCGRRIRIAIVDDHPMVREGLRAFLQLAEDMDVVAEASSGVEAVQICQTEAIDVILMDLVMPGPLDGVEAMRKILAFRDGIRVIALTSYASYGKSQIAIQLGASGFLHKDVSPEELLFAIRQSVQGRMLIETRVFDAFRKTEKQKDPAFESLTHREAEVLDAMGKGLSNKEIAAKLRITDKTVKVHVSNILRKLCVSDRTQAVVAAARCGWLTMEADETP